MLKRIYIDNFRCFVNFEYKPERKQLLLGAIRERQVVAAGSDSAIQGIFARRKTGRNSSGVLERVKVH